MNLDRSEQQLQMLDAVEALVRQHFPLSRLDNAAPKPLAALADFGAFVLALAESDGGAGFDLVDEALLHTRLGAALVAPSALAAALAPRIGPNPGALPAAALRSGKAILQFGDPAATTLVWAPEGLALVDTAGARRNPADSIDPALPLWRLDGQLPVLHQAAPAVQNIARLLISAQLLGIAEETRDRTLTYVQDRQQFGRPIGSFQAVKHRAADMALAAEIASAQLDLAAIALRDGWPDAGFQLAALARLARDAAMSNARAAIQLHGGFGFSAESGLHHFLKRAHLLGLLLGPDRMLDEAAPLTPSERN